MSRTRLNVFLELEHAQRLSALAAMKGLSRSSIVAAALASFLSGDGDDRREAAIARRLDQLTRQFDRLERENTHIKTLALFVRYYLSVTVAVPDAQQDALRAQGRTRFKQFVEQLARTLQRGRSLVKEVHEEVFPDHGRFFAHAEREAQREEPTG